MSFPFTSDLPVAFNRLGLAGRELEYIAETIGTGQVGGERVFPRRCEGLLQSVLQTPRALLTTSCTHALEMAALLLGLGPGDEVIVPTYTFASTANAFALRGAKPVFADIRPDTLNLDETLLPGLVTERTRAIVPVHYAGVGCEMDAILPLAQSRGIAVVEDNAHGLFGKYRGRWLGTFGSLATQSFHETKNITCGEGGALLVNDPGLLGRGEIVRQNGTDRARFFRGEVDRYSWVDLGSNYTMSDVLAAFLYGQLEAWAAIQAKRRAIWERYRDGLSGLAARHGLGLPVVPAHCEQAYHLFYLITRNLAERTALIAHLRAKGVQAVFHYVPLHLSPLGGRFGGRPGQCPVAEDRADRVLRLPFFNALAEGEQDRVIEAILEFYGT